MQSSAGTRRRIVLATHNQGKIREIQAILTNVPAEFLSAGDVGSPDVEETGATFEENARLKAAGVADAARLWAIADDSGLCVPALGGEPGVRSSRYSPEATDASNCARLLAEIRGRGLMRPRAHFVCVAVLAGPEGVLAVARGEVEGVILPEPHGENGFGYDPLFFHEGLGMTFAQASPVEKESVSHRGRAFREMERRLGPLLERA